MNIVEFLKDISQKLVGILSAILNGLGKSLCWCSEKLDKFSTDDPVPPPSNNVLSTDDPVPPPTISTDDPVPPPGQ